MNYDWNVEGTTRPAECMGPIGTQTVGRPTRKEGEWLHRMDQTVVHATAILHASVTMAEQVTVWPYTTILADVDIGAGAVIGDHVYIGRRAKIGPNVHVQHGAQLCEQIEVGEGAFIGVGVTTAPDRYPTVGNPHYRCEPPIIGPHATIGTAAVLLPGVRIGAYAMVGMGAVVTRDVPEGRTVVGVPARLVAQRRRPARQPDGLGDDVTYAMVDDHVAQITLHRPPLNTYTNATLRHLETAWAMAEDDAAVRVTILTGAGEHFCAGHDLKAAQTESLASEPPALHYGDLIVTKPVVGAVRGYALGGGASMALACDVLIMDTEGRLGYPQAAHGLVSIGGPQRLPRILPGFARWLLFSGTPMRGWQLKDLGLCVTAVAYDAVEPTALRYAQQIAAASPDSVRVLKQSIDEGEALPLAEAFVASKALAAAYEQTETYRENLAAFLEKRRAPWG